MISFYTEKLFTNEEKEFENESLFSYESLKGRVDSKYNNFIFNLGDCWMIDYINKYSYSKINELLLKCD